MKATLEVCEMLCYAVLAVSLGMRSVLSVFVCVAAVGALYAAQKHVA